MTTIVVRLSQAEAAQVLAEAAVRKLCAEQSRLFTPDLTSHLVHRSFTDNGQAGVGVELWLSEQPSQEAVPPAPKPKKGRR